MAEESFEDKTEQPTPKKGTRPEKRGKLPNQENCPL